MNELFFQIPDDQKIIVQLAEAIPSNWAWINGELNAPEALIASGQAVKDTGFKLSLFHAIKSTIVTKCSQVERGRIKPELFEIMVEQKLPGFVNFDQAGDDEEEVTFELAKRIAIGFLQKGYSGDLRFFSGHRNKEDNNYQQQKLKHDHFARCDMRHGSNASPARVRLEWNSRHSGREEDLASIATVCHSFNLRKYVPAA